ncbi:MAG: hypothetical protein H0W83_07070 [Planctomycetes bacterium]|nr:hypothetical protein [Planctomycetota bacterium]
MAIFFKVFHCRKPKNLFTGIRSFRIHEVSPPGGLLLYWCQRGRNFFPFRPQPKIWYHRPHRHQRTGESQQWSLVAKCWSGTPNTKLVMEAV